MKNHIEYNEVLEALESLYLIGLGSNCDVEGDESVIAAMKRAGEIIAKAKATI